MKTMHINVLIVQLSIYSSYYVNPLYIFYVIASVVLYTYMFYVFMSYFPSCSIFD
jgi:hypothetical protein